MGNDYHIVCIGASTSSPTLSFFLTPPPQTLIKPSKCPSSPFFLGNSPPIFGSLWTPPLKSVFSVNRHIKFSSLTLSHLLKATKFLANISQFKFLVMTEKNIFVYKPFLSLNILDFSLFFMWKLHPIPLKKVTPSKNWDPIKSSPFGKFGRRLKPPSRKGEGVHTMKN